MVCVFLVGDMPSYAKLCQAYPLNNGFLTPIWKWRRSNVKVDPNNWFFWTWRGTNQAEIWLLACFSSYVPSLKLTYHVKIDPWKSIFLVGKIIFRCYVSFRECNPSLVVVHLFFFRTSSIYIQNLLQVSMNGSQIPQRKSRSNVDLFGKLCFRKFSKRMNLKGETSSQQRYLEDHPI